MNLVKLTWVVPRMQQSPYHSSDDLANARSKKDVLVCRIVSLCVALPCARRSQRVVVGHRTFSSPESLLISTATSQLFILFEARMTAFCECEQVGECSFFFFFFFFGGLCMLRSDMMNQVNLVNLTWVVPRMKRASKLF